MAALLFVVSGCGGDDDDDTSASSTTFVAAGSGSNPEGSWAHPNGDLQNTRSVEGPISTSTVTRLGVAWSVPITAAGTFGGYASTPVVVDDTVFTQDLASNVQAIDLRSGQVKWEMRYDSPTVGPNGVAVGDGRVYGGTGDSAFALDEATGRELWNVRITRNDREGVDMAPGYLDGIVYISTVPGNARGFYRGDGVGIVHALDGATGRRIWDFATVPENLWDARHIDINSGGGLWHPPAFDGEGNIYIDVANPAPWPGTDEFPWGSSRPGPNLFTNSLVKLNATSGDVEWYRQVLPHDVYDWDLHLPPILTESNGKRVVLSSGKQGYVYAFDADNGDRLWERAVGVHNGHDRDNELALDGRYEDLQTPVTVYPGSLGGVETQMAVKDGVVFAPIVDLPTQYLTQERSRLDIAGGKGEMVALDVATGDQKWVRRFPTPAYGAATVVNNLVFTTTFDGTIYALDVDNGQIVWQERLPAGTNATIAIAGDTLITAASFPQGPGQQAQIIAYRIGATGRAVTPTEQPAAGETGEGESQSAETERRPEETERRPAEERRAETPSTPDTGTSAALLAAGRTVFTGQCAGCHTLAAAGANGTVGPNLDDLRPDSATVEQQVINGGGGMPAFGGRLSREQITDVSDYVAAVAGRGGDGGGGGGGGTP
ncbi:PQQ-binding-like beta-propeller repeat protein [Conexibacter sp. CPCC 206217]|uniref:outer membrane protein assembly factor BamB family protein n=1 Tax=Conexibacter sp. CPCC 206217 TaxID=3064574 RepID=UPI002728970B|nr:PQQ-binding-like beta-propeller repeat protein [Conexibacter sp. CPCC 206217]MDO8214095.1 PQQ-binding-like beta-propeller repeat protein [Conexibacter sp. CPCC 206217]